MKPLDSVIKINDRHRNRNIYRLGIFRLKGKRKRTDKHFLYYKFSNTWTAQSFLQFTFQPCPEVIKNFILNSAEHEVSNDRRHENIKKCGLF